MVARPTAGESLGARHFGRRQDVPGSSSGLSVGEAGYVSGARFTQAWRERETERLAARWAR